MTVSTVGASAAAIRRLADECPSVSLALSLHGASQGLRASIMPSAHACPLPELAAALDHHATTTVIQLRGGRACAATPRLAC